MSEDNEIIPVSNSISIFENQFSIGEKVLSDLASSIYVLILLKKNQIHVFEKDKFNPSILEYDTLSICEVNANQLLYFFSGTGYCYSIRFNEILQKNTKDLEAIFEIEIDEIFTLLPVPDNINTESTFIFFTTRFGKIKKTSIKEFTFESKRRIKSIKLKSNDYLISAKSITDQKQILIFSKYQKAIRFEEKQIPTLSKFAMGKKGITLEDEKDAVVGVSIGNSLNTIIFSEDGLVKRSHLDDYRITNRGGKGLRTFSEFGGHTLNGFLTKDDDAFLIISQNEIKRIVASDIPIKGRASNGVKIVKSKIERIVKIKFS